MRRVLAPDDDSEMAAPNSATTKAQGPRPRRAALWAAGVMASAGAALPSWSADIAVLDAPGALELDPLFALINALFCLACMWVALALLAAWAVYGSDDDGGQAAEDGGQQPDAETRAMTAAPVRSFREAAHGPHGGGASTTDEDDIVLWGAASATEMKQALAASAARHLATHLESARRTVRCKLLERRITRTTVSPAAVHGGAAARAAADAPHAVRGALTWDVEAFIDQCLDELGPRVLQGSEEKWVSLVMGKVAAKLALDELDALLARCLKGAAALNHRLSLLGEP